MFNSNIFLIIYLSIVFSSISGKSLAIDDDMCKVTENILCVGHVLNATKTTAKITNRLLNEIEKDIVKKYQNQNGVLLNNFIQTDLDSIYPQLPSSEYHDRFFQENNIDREYLVHLLVEAHHSMSFYYNSLQDILDIDDIYASEINHRLKRIQNHTIKQIICEYRSILNVYGHKWPLIGQVKRIQYSPKKYRSAPSIVQDAHSVIVIRLLSKWMNRLHSVIDNLEMKIY